MILSLSKKMLENTGFEFVKKVEVETTLKGQYDYIFNYELVDYFNNIDFEEATYKFNKLYEFFKHDIIQVFNETGTEYKFKKVNDNYIISVIYH